MEVLDGYQKSTAYTWIDEYADYENCIISEKTINVPDVQQTVTTDHNSQYLPFLMDRYYDGVDLLENKLIKLVFKSANGITGKITAINVQYSDDLIVFGVLLTNAATSGTGQMSIQIEVTGQNSENDDYVWKSYVNKQIRIKESIEVSGEYDPEGLPSAVEQVAKNRDDIKLNKAEISRLSESITEIDERVTTLEQGGGSSGNTPTKVSQLENDSGYQTEAEVSEAITTALSAIGVAEGGNY